MPKAEDIVDVVIGQPGPTSDIKICRETLSKFDSQQTFIGDKAYLGENQIRTPDKKPKNGELTENQIKENKVLSSRRIFVEHLISSGLIPRRSRRIIEKGSSVCVMQWTGVIRDRTLIEKDIGRFLSIVFDLERANHLNLLPDKDLVDLCHPIEPYQVTKSQEYLQLHQNLQLSLF